MPTTQTQAADNTAIQLSPDDLLAESTFADLYQQYSRRVYRICHRITRNDHDARDASQETFATIHRRLPGLRSDDNVAGWVYRIAVNTCLSLKRHARSRRSQLLSDITGHGEDERELALPDERAQMPFEEPERAEMQVDVRRAIAGLSDKLREVVLLRYYEGLSYEEISERIAVSVGTVKSRLFRAHESLSYWLTPAMPRHSA